MGSLIHEDSLILVMVHRTIAVAAQLGMALHLARREDRNSR
jgi:hypothetical protein